MALFAANDRFEARVEAVARHPDTSLRLALMSRGFSHTETGQMSMADAQGYMRRYDEMYAESEAAAKAGPQTIPGLPGPSTIGDG